MDGCAQTRIRIIESGDTAAWLVARHLSSCPSCTSWLSDLGIAARALRRLPAAQAPVWFEARMAGAIAREQARDVSVRGGARPIRAILSPIAAAAVIAVMAATVWFLESSKSPGLPAGVPEQGVVVGIALRAYQPVPGAKVMLHLPPGIDLAGAKREAGGRHLAWRQDIPAGSTDLTVGLVAFTPGDHRVDVLVCRDAECARGAVVVSAGGDGVRVTSIEAPAGTVDGLALSIGAERELSTRTRERQR